MDKTERYPFPNECRGCYENCFTCTRRIGSASVPVIRELVAARTMKLQAIDRARRDIERIDSQLNALLSRSDK